MYVALLRRLVGYAKLPTEDAECDVGSPVPLDSALDELRCGGWPEGRTDGRTDGRAADRPTAQSAHHPNERMNDRPNERTSERKCAKLPKPPMRRVTQMCQAL